MRRTLGQGGDERDRRRATADDHDSLARVVEILRPLLRVDDSSAEACNAGPLRRVPALVIVIAGAEIEEVAGELDHRFVVSGFSLHGPARVVRRPGDASHAMVVSNSLVQAVLGGSLADVVEDCWAVGHGLGFTPGAEAIAERVHVAVGANAWVTKQIPGAAHRLAPFEDDKTFPRTLSLEMARAANSRQPRPNHYHVHVFHTRPLRLEKVVHFVAHLLRAAITPAKFHCSTAASGIESRRFPQIIFGGRDESKSDCIVNLPRFCKRGAGLSEQPEYGHLEA